jgi:hypothetical protein
MTSYQVNHVSRSFSPAMITNLLALSPLLVAGQTIDELHIDRAATLLDCSYNTGTASSSFDQYRVLLGSSLEQNQDKFVESVSGFYEVLLAKQEPLGEEFSRILHENLWDLYER